MGVGNSKSKSEPIGSKTLIPKDLLIIQKAQHNLLERVKKNIMTIKKPMEDITEQLTQLDNANIQTIQTQLQDLKKITDEYRKQSVEVDKKIEDIKNRYAIATPIEQKTTKGGGTKGTNKKKRKLRKKTKRKRKSREHLSKQKGG